jgi:hypothetical protein
MAKIGKYLHKRKKANNFLPAFMIAFTRMRDALTNDYSPLTHGYRDTANIRYSHA